MTKAQSKTQVPTKESASRKATVVAEANPVADKPHGKARTVAGKATGVETKPAKRAAASAVVAEVPVAAVSAVPKRGRPAKAAAPAVVEEPAARRGRKTKIVEAEEDPHDDVSDDVDAAEVDVEVAAVEVVEEVAAIPAPKTRKASRAREKQLLKEFGYDDSNITDEELGRRRARLKSLIKMGKTRGFLTYGEINDHIPDNLADPELMETIVSMLNDVGIAVYETTPDAQTLLLNQHGPTASSEEEAEEEALSLIHI